MMKLDILATAAHPDDIELSCGGTLIKHIKKGQKVGILDLTQGELGSRGTIETRKLEAKTAADIMGISIRENLGLPDGFFTICQENILKVITIIRKYQPEVVIANALKDRHPDHERAAQLVKEAWFLSGLRMIETHDENGQPQAPWRPKRLLHYLQNRDTVPNLIININEEFDLKMKAILAYKTQFTNEARPGEPTTYISNPNFVKLIESRDRYWGHCIGTIFAEGFMSESIVGLEDLDSLNLPELP